ncbi:ATP-binding protein [Phenylobacterium sp. LjRoot225]|uniref:sensor histidine kinase n=1 Tax=Phenylobacterium sp. LjRoot225 TaxID=3342285 RepID=UPI003ECED459
MVGPLSAVGFVLLAAALRTVLGERLPGLTVFSLYYPAILGAALIGGEAAAALALVLSASICWLMLHNARGLLVPMSTITVNVLLFVATAAFVGAAGARLRWLLRRRRVDILRLGEREARYRALFEGVSEGFALMDGVWSDDGRLLDFALDEANPALLKMFRLTPDIIGRRQSEHPTRLVPTYIEACERAFAGPPVHLEIFHARAQRWYDIRLSRVGDTKLAQIFVDITDRKAAESRQTEMFDELNHRVKNNLAAVSAMLSLQARAADDPRVRDQLNKAVDRIATIGEVHASLYRVSSTDEVDFAAYLRRLCERLTTGLIDSERVRIDVDADPAMASLDEAVALGLIVNELVTNAAKYAYPPPAGGVIRVELRNRPGEFLLKVSDDGQGISTGGSPTGIGMRLVRSLVQQCRGELGVAQDGGASFTIRLPEHGRPGTCSTQSPLL